MPRLRIIQQCSCNMNICYLFPLLFQIWNLQKSACDCACISSKMPLNDSNLWWLKHLYSRISYNVCIDVLIKRNDSYILQSPPCMAIKLQGFDTILTFGGSHLWIKAYQAFDCLKLGLTPNLQGWNWAC